MPNTVKIKRGTSAAINKSENGTLQQGELLYNLDKNYLTVGKKDGDALNSTPISARELVGYKNDDATIGTELGEQFSIQADGTTLNIVNDGDIKIQSETNELQIPTNVSMKYHDNDYSATLTLANTLLGNDTTLNIKSNKAQVDSTLTIPHKTGTIARLEDIEESNKKIPAKIVGEETITELVPTTTVTFALDSDHNTGLYVSAQDAITFTYASTNDILKGNCKYIITWDGVDYVVYEEQFSAPRESEDIKAIYYDWQNIGNANNTVLDGYSPRTVDLPFTITQDRWKNAGEILIYTNSTATQHKIAVKRVTGKYDRLTPEYYWNDQSYLRRGKGVYSAYVGLNSVDSASSFAAGDGNKLRGASHASAAFGGGNTLKDSLNTFVAGQENKTSDDLFGAVFGYNNNTQNLQASHVFGTNNTVVKNAEFNSSAIIGSWNTVGNDETVLVDGQRATCNLIVGYNNTMLPVVKEIQGTKTDTSGTAVIGITNSVEDVAWCDTILGNSNKTQIPTFFNRIIGNSNTVTKTDENDTTSTSFHTTVIGNSNTVNNDTQQNNIFGNVNTIDGKSRVYIVGRNNTADRDDQTIMGKFAAEDTTAVFKYGFGTKAEPKNLFTIHEDGTASVASAPVNDDDIVRLKELKEKQALVIETAGTITAEQYKQIEEHEDVILKYNGKYYRKCATSDLEDSVIQFECAYNDLPENALYVTDVVASGSAGTKSEYITVSDVSKLSVGAQVCLRESNTGKKITDVGWLTVLEINENTKTVKVNELIDISAYTPCFLTKQIINDSTKISGIYVTYEDEEAGVATVDNIKQMLASYQDNSTLVIRYKQSNNPLVGSKGLTIKSVDAQNSKVSFNEINYDSEILAEASGNYVTFDLSDKAKRQYLSTIYLNRKGTTDEYAIRYNNHALGNNYVELDSRVSKGKLAKEDVETLYSCNFNYILYKNEFYRLIKRYSSSNLSGTVGMFGCVSIDGSSTVSKFIEVLLSSNDSSVTAGNWNYYTKSIDLSNYYTKEESDSRYVAQSSEAYVVYSTDISGNQINRRLESNAVINSIPFRGGQGELKVGNPIVDLDAVNKKYGDDNYFSKGSTELVPTTGDTISKEQLQDLETGIYYITNSYKLFGMTGKHWIILQAYPSDVGRTYYASLSTGELFIAQILADSDKTFTGWVKIATTDYVDNKTSVLIDSSLLGA